MKIVCARKNSLQGLQTEFPFLIKNSIIFLRPKSLVLFASAMGAEKLSTNGLIVRIAGNFDWH